MEQPNGAHGQKGDLEVTGVSRSGRVRKKSSKLMDFQSPDEIETRAKKATVIGKQPIVHKQASGNFLPTPTSQSTYSAVIPSNKNFSDHTSSYDEKAESEESETEDEDDDDDDDDEDDDEEMDDMTGTVDNEDESESYTDPTVRKSIYMSEKSTKKKVMKDGKMVFGKAQRKDKGKTRFTAYMLWARDARKQMLAQQPDLDFGSISRRLGEMWANVPMSEKLNWKRRLKRYISKPKTPDNKKETTNISSKFLNKGQNISNSSFTNNNSAKTNIMSANIVADVNTTNSANSNRTKKNSQSDYSNFNESPPDHHSNYQNKKPINTANKLSPTSVGMYKVTGIDPVDVAAHLKLLGDSLTIIGERLKEHEGQITVSGSLSVLLDSLLCSLGPLMCLTTQIPGFYEKNQHLRETLHNTLDNIAYVMPGL